MAVSSACQAVCAIETYGAISLQISSVLFETGHNPFYKSVLHKQVSYASAYRHACRVGRFVAPNTSGQPVPSSPVITDPQLEALLRIKSAMDKTNQLKEWTRESGAKSGYCKWKAVECDQGMVTWIVITFSTAGSALQGTLPPASAFAGLTQLRRVDLADQPGISGTLPSDWPLIQPLEDIRVVNNSVTGSMPADWAKFGPNLLVLQLWSNKLTLRIPDAYKVLTALDMFEVYDNQLTGTIPASLGSFSRLKKLYLYSNMLSGTIPPSLKSLSALTDLDLSRNQLTGTLPGVFGELTRLVFLHVGLNKLSGTLPDQYKALVALETLGVEGNSFVGTVPASWASMLRLKSIWVHENFKLGGCLPKAWSGKIDLGEWGIGDTKITGFC